MRDWWTGTNLRPPVCRATACWVGVEEVSEGFVVGALEGNLS